MSEYEAKGHYQNNKVAEHYNAQYRSRLSLSNFRHRLVGRGEVRAFKRMLYQLPPRSNVLDVACGTGRYSKLLLDYGCTVTGIDISNQMLHYAREVTKEHPNLQGFQVGDAANLPFEDNQFDGVTCIRLYQRIPTELRQKMLHEVKRVGRKWAILFFGMTTPWLKIRQTLRQIIITGRPNNPNAVNIDQMKKELSEAKMTLVDNAWVFPIIASGLIVRVNLT